MPIQPELSVVIPVKDEAENVANLAAEIHAALKGVIPFEMIFVDDGSSDATAERILAARVELGDHLRLLRHARNAGQSAAVATGVRHARAPWIATLDGDGQNNPADIPKLLARVGLPGTADSNVLVNGHRVSRQDTWLRRISSRVANTVRGGLLNDNTPDSGCGLKLLPRELFLRLPYFDHMHRFIPALVIRAGGQVVSVPVDHRPRVAGRSKYGLNNRLWVGLVDLLGMIWLNRRARSPQQVSEE
ncbi:MAG: glycosyltransferase family 2 protein [Pseudomonadota bacterium]|nr:glycosyltransferase family 2 protein [Pseudomonadota bacterium]